MDLFAGLDGLSSNSPKNVSLAEQRRRKELQDQQTVKAFEDLQFLGSSSSISRSTSSNNATPSPPPAANVDDDLFGIFKSNPAPNPPPSKKEAPEARPTEHVRTQDTSQREQPKRQEPGRTFKQAPRRREFSDDALDGEDEPALPRRNRSSENHLPKPVRQQHNMASDRGVAQLVEMGFDAENSQRALDAMNGSVHGAVNWLMAEAQGLPLPEPRRGGFSSALGSGDISEFQAVATQIGSSMFSKASSLFSKGRKELEKMYNQYNGQYDERLSSEPAWMKDRAKHVRDGKFEEADFEMPSRPRRQKPTVDNESRGTAGTATRTTPPKDQNLEKGRSSSNMRASRPSRAELFRQRQRERNLGTASSRSSPGPAVVDEATMPSLRESSQISSARASSAEASSSSTNVETPNVDLLNLSSSSPGANTQSQALTPTQNDMYRTSRELGSGAYRKGDYESAIEHYSTALQVVPERSAHRAILLSNRSAAYLKAGNLRGAYDDTSMGISILPPRGAGAEIDDKETSMTDIWVKLVTRNAQAAENMEKFEDALKSWQLLLDNGYASAPVLDAKRRCMKALNPEIVAKQEKASSDTSGAKKSQRRGWGTMGAAPTSAEGKAALEKVKANHDKMAEEERQKDLLRDKVSARIDSWKKGNENNLIALLSTLQNVLGDSCDWTPVSPSELVIPKKVRVVYMKAVARTHPDKVPSSAPLEVRMISQSVFVTIQEAWEVYRGQNNL